MQDDTEERKVYICLHEVQNKKELAAEGLLMESKRDSKRDSWTRLQSQKHIEPLNTMAHAGRLADKPVEHRRMSSGKRKQLSNCNVIHLYFVYLQ